MKFGLYLIYGLTWALSRLPMRVLYALSDCLFPLIYHIARYRRKLVRRQLQECFPQQPAQWHRQVERKFYHFFCDYIVETLKLMHMGSNTEDQILPGYVRSCKPRCAHAARSSQ